MNIRHLPLFLALLAVPSLLSACAEVPKSPQAQAESDAANDPYESVNRVTFDVNDFLDRLLIKPLTELYRFAVPDYVRDRVANVVSNYGEPVVLANNLLQGRFGDAGTTVQRFLVNTTVGVGGIFEVANDWGLPKQTGDFGQTLYTWGAGSGPYLVLPLFGPSNVRDGIGIGVDSAISPWGYVAGIGGNGDANRVTLSEFGAEGLTKRDQNLDGYDALRSGSIDFYAELRSVVTQYRNKQLGIKPTNAPVFEDYK